MVLAAYNIPLFPIQSVQLGCWSRALQESRSRSRQHRGRKEHA